MTEERLFERCPNCRAHLYEQIRPSGSSSSSCRQYCRECGRERWRTLPYREFGPWHKTQEENA
jgi:hypothetical protein